MEFSVKRDGLNLHGEYQKASNKVVILSHGFTANLHYYDEFEPVIRAQGYSTIRYDFNGHGKSDGKQQDMTVLNEISDLFAIIQYAKDLGYKDIYLLGQSQGGVVSSMAAGYYHDLIKGLILLAPAATLKDDAIKGTLMGKNYDPQNIPDEIDTGWYKVGGNYFRVAQLLPIYEVAKQFKGPVLLIHGTNDTVVDPIASKRYNEVYENCEFHLVEGENHNISNHRDLALEYIKQFLTKN